jgi:hypothetical protein
MITALPAMAVVNGWSPCPLWQVDFRQGLPAGFGSTGTPRVSANGVLIEAATLNQATYSNDLSQWNVNGNAVLHPATAPDGGAAYSIAMDALWYSGVYRNLAGLTTGAPLTFSGYFKYVSGDGTVLFGSDQTVFGGGSDPALLTFSSQDGSVISASSGVNSYSVQAVGNGWYRAQLTATLATGTGSSILVFHGAPVAGENAAWGIQAEQTGVMTSLIATGVDPVSRAADVVTLGNLAAMGFNPVEGTLLVEGTFEGVNGGIDQPLLQLDDGSASNRLLLGQSGGQLVAKVTAGGSDVLAANALSGPAANTLYKLAVGYKPGVFGACANGGTVSTAASGAVPGGLKMLRLGSDGSAFANGWVRKVTYFPHKLADAELKLLTA